MTEIDTSRRKDMGAVDQAFDQIRKHVANVEAERDRYGEITATIRVNAMKRGATDEQIAAFLSGEECFIQWMIEQVKSVDSPTLLTRAEKAERERDAAWNAAIEAAAQWLKDECLGVTAENMTRALKRGSSND